MLVGAFAEAIRSRIAFRREKAWLLQVERKTHLEEVYEVLERLRDAYSLFYADALRTAALGAPGNLSQAMKPVPWARLRMLVFLYLPELKPFLEDVELTGPKFGSAAADVMMAGNAATRQQLITRLDQTFQDLTKTVDAMRDQIVVQSRVVAQAKTTSIGRSLPKPRAD